MNINWISFLIVAGATLFSTAVVVGLYALGVRLYAISAERPAERRLHRLAGYGCFAACALAVLYGVYLIIPSFHK
ncbi:hypothetical protein [Paenarthrobacter sp. DKR-5]|uniref:hypothetical protein n=1 Tax=Paenarthrobacter sp. DKR-5 TaxID=2835535 RepID=UPI0027DE441B|nr:hypothetical protein [Paenarthrobacter sp. DKR-5]